MRSAALAAFLQKRATGRVEIDYQAVNDGADTMTFGFILKSDQAHR